MDYWAGQRFYNKLFISKDQKYLWLPQHEDFLGFRILNKFDIRQTHKSWKIIAGVFGEYMNIYVY